MAITSCRASRSRGAYFASVSTAALIGLMQPAMASGQTAPPSSTPAPVAPDAASPLPADAPAVPSATETDKAPGSDIVVTGTRVVRDGYRAPTPTSVIGAAEISAKAPNNLADFVNELPSLAGSTTPRGNIASIGAGLVGINALNLRALGANRTLVLLDGQRLAASNLSGLVDINVIPQALVKRIDVVTGGASADWGSDAVAGVVNFILDKDFVGVKGEAQGGVTTYGDDRNYKLSLTAGTKFADGRGHVTVSAEDAYNAGIRGVPRDWYDGSKVMFNPAYTATNGQPQLLVAPHTGFSNATPGGIISAGPLAGTYFGPGGTPTQFNYGPVVNAPFMQGGDWEYADFARSGDLDPELSRQNVFARVSFDVSNHIQLFAQASYSRAHSQVAVSTQQNLGNLTIRSDNAFIPASASSRLTALGLTSFAFGTLNADLGPTVATTKRDSYRAVVGAKGDFDALGSNWTWDVYGQRTINHSYVGDYVTITNNYNMAIDAVRNANGAIVCRSTLTNPTNGCVPYNVFGTGVASDAAKRYVRGTSFGNTRLTENVVAATVHGNPFSNWAGPISIAAGIEHRREAVGGDSDPLSLARAYYAGNFAPSFGSYSVTEGFFETVVPLAKDLPFAKTLDLNAAVRETSYSISGSVTTWKAGLTYSPVSDIAFRVTRSRDIRAPNLSELFQAGQTLTTSLPDPFRGNANTSLLQVTQGNLNLKPEKADTLGVGVVFEPRFLPGFAASVDYYNIDIRDAISSVNAATLVNQCFLGNTTFCSQISRNATGTIINGLTPIGTVTVLPVNLAKQINRGLDFEASYRNHLFGGNLTLRMLATRFLKNYTNDGITPATDTVGTNGTNGSLRNSLPRWKYVGTVSWEGERLGASVTGRGFSGGVLNTSWIECTTGCPTSTVANMTVNNNRVPGALYFDTNVSYKFSRSLEAYLAIDNIGNRDPAQVAYGPSVGQAPISVNALLYDIVGRTFRVGVRFKM